MFATVDALEIESAANDVVADTWKIWDTTTADEHDGVFLEVVTLAADVGPNFLAVSETDTRNFTKSGVWFFRGFGGYFDADAAFQRSGLVVVTGFQSVDD